ncbi:hypothetical protein HK098_000770 [Nowakowskiella sp. JEL0407]|nr:hypothetical protein HK098_000770 [Nowakowskiella sp. JEL0407]
MTNEEMISNLNSSLSWFSNSLPSNSTPNNNHYSQSLATKLNKYTVVDVLFSDLIFIIVDFLPYESVFALSQTCWKLYVTVMPQFSRRITLTNDNWFNFLTFCSSQLGLRLVQSFYQEWNLQFDIPKHKKSQSHTNRADIPILLSQCGRAMNSLKINVERSHQHGLIFGILKSLDEKTTNLKYLEIRGIVFWEKELMNLGSLLYRTRCLETLIIRGESNARSVVPIKALCEFARGMSKMVYLEQVSIGVMGDGYFDDSSLKEIINSLCQSRKIRDVSFESWMVGPMACKALAELIHGRNIISLKFTSNVVGDIRSIAEAIKTCKTLENFSLIGTRLDLPLIHALLRSFYPNNIRVLNLNLLSFSGCSFSDEFTVNELFGRFFEDQLHIKKLVMPKLWISLGPKFIERGISLNSEITELDIRSRCFGNNESEMRSLAEILKSNKAIRKLYISLSKCETMTLLKLTSALEWNTFLQEIHVDIFDAFPVDRVLAKMFKQNQSIIRVTLRGNGLSISEVSLLLTQTCTDEYSPLEEIDVADVLDDMDDYTLLLQLLFQNCDNVIVTCNSSGVVYAGTVYPSHDDGFNTVKKRVTIVLGKRVKPNLRYLMNYLKKLEG